MGSFRGIFRCLVKDTQTSIHWQLECLFNNFVNLISKQPRACVLLVPFEVNPWMIDGFSSQRARNAENLIHSPWNKHSPYHILDIVNQQTTASSNRPVAQIPQCTSPISHNAPFCNRNVHTFLLENGALWDICLVHYGICEMGLLNISGELRCNHTRFSVWIFIGKMCITMITFYSKWLTYWVFVQVGHSGCGEANQSLCPTRAPPGLLFLWNHMLYIWCKNTYNSWCFVHSRITTDVIALHNWKGDFLNEMFGTCDYCWDVSLKYFSARSSRNIIYSHSAINIS